MRMNRTGWDARTWISAAYWDMAGASCGGRRHPRICGTFLAVARLMEPGAIATGQVSLACDMVGMFLQCSNPPWRGVLLHGPPRRRRAAFHRSRDSAQRLQRRLLAGIRNANDIISSPYANAETSSRLGTISPDAPGRCGAARLEGGVRCIGGSARFRRE